MATTITMPDIKTLEQVRKLLINAMSSIDLTLNTEYKLSKIDDDRPTTVFRIEISDKSVTATRVKNAIKHWFDYIPTFQDSPLFIRINTEKQYNYLIGRKIQNAAEQ